MKPIAVAYVVLLLLAAPVWAQTQPADAAAPAVVEELRTLHPRSNVDLPYVLTRTAAGKPRTVLLLLSGGNGEHRLALRGSAIEIYNDQRFTALQRTALARADVAVALLDSSSDQSKLDDGYRASDAHADNVRAVIEDLQGLYPGSRVVLIGHSNGSVSAAHLGVKLGKRLDGVIIINGRLAKHWWAGDGLSNFDFSRISARLLFIHHHKDDCSVTPYDAAAKLGERYPLITVEDPNTVKAGGCGLGPHNMTGKEAAVVQAILDWIDGKPTPKAI